MNLQQLRFVQAAARHRLNLTETAQALHTSQPGVSKAILEFEQELGVDVFVRRGKRLTRVTEPGRLVLASVDAILREIANLRRIGQEHSQQDAGTLSIATTHAQARYVLPEPIARLRRRHPNVRVVLHQGTPGDVARMLLDDVADLGIATEALADEPELVSRPCYEWQHVVVVPRGHPLADAGPPTLARLAAEPLVTYHPTFSGRTRVDAAFARARLAPQIAMEAIDADVIKTYVRLGLGVGILAEMAVREDPPGGELVALAAGHLFGRNVTRIAHRRGAYLRGFVHAFTELLDECLGRAGPAPAPSAGDAP